MQITKVNNNRIGVKQGNDAKITGILYQTPGNYEGMRNVSNLVSNRINQAKRLYSPLVTQKEKGDEPTPEEVKQAGAYDVLNRLFRESGGRWESWQPDDMCKAAASLRSDSRRQQDYDKEDVRKLFKKSLARNDAFLGLSAKLCNYLLCSGKALTEEESGEFIAAVRKDYRGEGKGKGRDRIVKSIEHQNLAVQPVREPGQEGFLLAISGGEGKKSGSKYKEADRRALNRFLTEYANPDKGEREKMLRKLRRLFVLFAYGEAEVQKLTGDFDVLKSHVEGKARKEYIRYKRISEENGGRTIEELNFDEFKTGDAKELKSEVSAARQKLRRVNIGFYHRAMNALEEPGGDVSELYFDAEINGFWIRYFESAFEKRYAHFSARKKDYMLPEGYLEKIWKDAIAYCATKYIAVGKDVWNFTMEDLSKTDSDRNLGVIPKRLQNGISSFDLETIKARETLQRKLAVYVAFAANNYARQTVEMTGRDSDFLVFGTDMLSNTAKEGALHNTLQFFGGESTWPDEIKGRIQDALGKEAEQRGLPTDVVLLDNIKKALYSVRNESFHFTTMSDGKEWNAALMGILFEKDVKEVSQVIKKQFYSNNLPMFYSEADLRKALDALYAQENPRMTQVPAFRTVFVRKHFSEFLRNRLSMSVTWEPEVAEKWRSGLYFLLKEIYYNDFVTSTDARKYFDAAVENLGNLQADEVKNDRALVDFQKAVWSIEGKNREDARPGNVSLEEVCQYIMTEQNRRNQSGRKVQTSKGSKELKFKHYSLLLQMALREAFAGFLEAHTEKYAFIKNPAPKSEIPAEEDYLSGWSCKAYDRTLEKFKQDPAMQKWYILGRLLPSKQINLLKGVVKNYEQFVKDIKRRAEVTQTKLLIEKETTEYKDIVTVLDICSKLGGDFSNQISDYFGEEEYEEFLRTYIDYDEIKYAGPEISAKFFDEVNPILNRNVVMAKLYGCKDVLGEVISRVTAKDIERLNKLKEDISGYIKTGNCKDVEEQKKVVKYQRLNNKVELRTIYDYAEIMNELLGQLVSWSFMRERDLLYYQLGFHYMCLKNDAAGKPAAYTRITDMAGHVTNGAILSQIAALYVYGLELYVDVDANGNVTSEDPEKQNKNKSAGAKINAFLGYMKNIYPDKNSEELYYAGLELFENIQEHDQIVGARNYIDHFHYYMANGRRSLLDLYSEVFDRFFGYSNNFRKSVPVIFRNILLRHFMMVTPCFETGTKKMDKKGVEKSMALLRIQSEGIRSDVFTYKYNSPKSGLTQETLPAVSLDYMEHVAKILYYPEEAPADLVDKEKYKKDEVTGENYRSSGDRGGKSGWKDNKNRKDGKKSNRRKEDKALIEKYSDKGSASTSLGDLLKGMKFDS